jgi:hypothetical protein
MEFDPYLYCGYLATLTRARYQAAHVSYDKLRVYNAEVLIAHFAVSRTSLARLSLSRC